jgi:pimeloyl-ACP methyl ester carboxylesterase
MKLPLVALFLLIAAVPVLGHAQAADSAAVSVAPLAQQVSFQSGGITLRSACPSTGPADSQRRLAIPGLWLCGGRDVNVPVRLLSEHLDSLAAGGRPFDHVLFPDPGHQLPENEALPALFSWLQRTVPAPQGRLSP